MKSLIDEFKIKRNSSIASNIPDYETFPDKELLDDLRLKIINQIYAHEQENIDNIVDDAILGYDLTNMQRNHLLHVVENEINGYGPLTELLEDENITEIMVNSPNEIYIEINGRLIKDESVSFINDDHIIRTLNKLVASCGKTIDLAYPFIDARTKHGFRIYGFLPPLTNGPVFNIHKFLKTVSDIEDFIRMGSLTPYMATFLASCIKGKCNVLITSSSGGGGTTLLSALSNFILDDERIIVIEDMTELKINKKNVISLETNMPLNKEPIALTEMVKKAIKMRADRLIIGELNGMDFFPILQVLMEGQQSIMTTIHSSGIKEAIENIEALSLNIPTAIKNEYLVKAFDIVINIERLSDGKRKVTSISELKLDKDKLVIDDIFAFKQKGVTKEEEVNGEYIFYDNKKPKVLDKLHRLGIHDIDFMYQKK